MKRIHINAEVIAEDERLDSQYPRPAETRPLRHHPDVLQLGELPGQVEECELGENTLLTVEGTDLLHGIALKEISDVVVRDGLMVSLIQTVAQHFQVGAPEQRGLLIMN